MRDLMTPVLRANACTFTLKFCCGLIAAFLGTAAFPISAQNKEHPTGTVSFRPASAGRAIPSTPVIIDTDIGDDIDDAYALALAVRSPELRILGITTAFGDTALRAHVAARMLDTLNHPGIPIYVGVNSTRKFENFSQTEYARADTHVLVMRDAIDFLLKTALRYPHQVTLIALGPMDNIGAAIDRDPSAFRLLKQVVLMGGSVRTGYGGGPPSAEWNILNNVPAARKLFSSGVPVSMMPLDSTQIRMGAVRDVILNQPDRLSVDLTELTRESNRPDPVLFDPVAVAAVINPKLCPTQPMHLEVDDKGFTLETPGRPNVNVCLTSDREGFLKLLAERLEPRVGESN
jgi:inosine-uridine nucleoside N-ribohydrolase